MFRPLLRSTGSRPVFRQTRPYSSGSFRRFGRRLFRIGIVAAAVPVVFLAGFTIYDATTYKSGPLQIDVKVPKESLELRSGGPKNLPIAEHWIDDVELGHTEPRPRLLVIGSGWGAVALLRGIDTNKYNVTMVSPTNHFLFTPLLPSAAVGTLSLDSLVEPIRELCRKKSVRYIEGAAHDLVFDQSLAEIRTDGKNGEAVHFYVPYEKVVIAAGAKSNTHGVKGLEYCYNFKNAEDCTILRHTICRNLESAALPTTSEEERKRLLSFVVCGGGPTGVELASEIYDLLKEDVPTRFPGLLLNNASVHIIQSRSAILNTYDEQISKYAMERFISDGLDLQTNSRVEEVRPESVLYSKVDESGNKQVFELPSGLTLWTTGITLTRFAKKIMEHLKDDQHNRRAIETDAQLHVFGAPPGVYAIGDCSTVRTDLVEDLKKIIQRRAAKVRRNLDHLDSLNVDQIKRILDAMMREEPQAISILSTMRDRLVHERQPTEKLSMDECIQHLKEANKKVVSLPATAQRANQQGLYLARKLNRIPHELEDGISKPFSFVNLGSLAYVSNGAIIDAPFGIQFLGGILAMYAWRGAYFSMTVTPRARTHMMFDWMYRGLFGRQIYSYDRTN